MSTSPLGPVHLFRQFPDLLPSFWSRQRGSLGQWQVMMSLMVMSVLGTKGYERTIEEMKQYLGTVLSWTTPEETPTGQALSQARRKLTPTRCREVARQVYGLCSAAREHAAIGYGGFRLLALDGTKIALPAYQSMIAHFGCPVQAPKGPQASFTLLWDVGANQPVDWRVGPYRVCERLHAVELLAGARPDDLVLGDRNFASRRIMFLLATRQANWLMCIRSSGAGTLTEVAEFVASARSEQLVHLLMRDHRGQPIADTPTVAVRLIRCVSPEGNLRVFITSLLDAERHPAQTLIDLYTTRWRVETAFRELKIWHGLERFHARYVDGIYQEITALMIFQLLASELEAKARVHHHLAPDTTPATTPPLIRPTIRFNRRIVADCAISLLFAGAKGDDELTKAFDYALFRIWRYRQTIAPDRSFPRERKSPARGWKDKNRKGGA